MAMIKTEVTEMSMNKKYKLVDICSSKYLRCVFAQLPDFLQRRNGRWYLAVKRQYIEQYWLILLFRNGTQFSRKINKVEVDVSIQTPPTTSLKQKQIAEALHFCMWKPF